MKFRIRSKVAAALSVPLLALAGVVGYGTTEALAEADRVDAQTDLALVAVGPRSLSTALQAERDVVVHELAGLGGQNPSIDTDVAAAQAAVDASAAALETFRSRASTEVASVVTPTLEALADLDAVRDRVADLLAAEGVVTAADVADVAAEYGSRIDVVFAATAAAIGDIERTSLRNGAEIVDAANHRNESAAAALVAVATADDAAIGAAAASLARAELHRERVDRFAVGPYETVVSTEAADRLDAFAELVNAHLAGDPVALGDLAATGAVGDTSVADAATDVLAAEGAAALAAAQDRVQIFVIGAAVAATLAILVTYFATVSITRPLRGLRREAEEMASTRLPRAVVAVLEAPAGQDADLPEVQPIEIRSRDEVGDVAKALNKVQTRTLALAADQAMLRRNFADSFVNLGRRNQLLLDRQLEFITHLEAHETDPDLLDSLFQLDHLATRMRRNAESLLVLAGAGSPRQWGAPVPLSDVVRAGIGEVEHYRRVALRAADDAAIEGGSAAGLAHVVAELTENALAFSPPEETVEIKGRRDATGYVISVVDSGIGMDDAALSRANRRLSGADSFTVEPSRYLGHYVAGRLAAQLGITVTLQANPAGGVVANITVPARLLADAEAAAVPEAPAAAPEVAPAAPEATAIEREPDAPAAEADDLQSWLTVAPPATPVEAVAPDPDPEPELAPAAEPAALDRVVEETVEAAEATEAAEADEVVGTDPTAPPRIDWMAADAWEDPADAVSSPQPPPAPVPPAPVSPPPAPVPPSRVPASEGLRETARLLREASATKIVDGGRTEGGLPRRVPGAQRPGAGPLLDRGTGASEPSGADPAPASLDASAGEAHPDAAGSDAAAPDPAVAAAGALGFLTAFQEPAPDATADPITEEQA